MTDPRHDQQQQPRIAWALPLGLGIGGTLAAVLLFVSVGVGYDVAGRSPPPLVLVGLGLLVGPQFLQAWLNYPGARVQQLQAPPAEQGAVEGSYRRSGQISAPIQPAIIEAIRMIDNASQVYGSHQVAKAISEAIARLPNADRLLQLPAGKEQDDD